MIHHVTKFFLECSSDLDQKVPRTDLMMDQSWRDEPGSLGAEITRLQKAYETRGRIYFVTVTRHFEHDFDRTGTTVHPSLSVRGRKNAKEAAFWRIENRSWLPDPGLVASGPLRRQWQTACELTADKESKILIIPGFREQCVVVGDSRNLLSAIKREFDDKADWSCASNMTENDEFYENVKANTDTDEWGRIDYELSATVLARSAQGLSDVFREAKSRGITYIEIFTSGNIARKGLLKQLRWQGEYPFNEYKARHSNAKEARDRDEILLDRGESVCMAVLVEETQETDETSQSEWKF